MIFRSLFIFIFLFCAAAAGAAPISLADAQRLAAANAPQLEAQAAGVRAAQQASIGATEQADPKLIAGIDNLPADGADRFNVTRDFMTMRKIGFMQEFTRDEKLKLRGARAEAEVRKEEAALSLATVNLQRDVALAWIERYFAEQQRALLVEMSRETELQISAANAALAGGKGMASDTFNARLANAQLDDRVIDSERLIARAEANLGQIRAKAEDAKRAHAADIEAMLADWNAANKRIDRYASDLLPLAHERSEAALAAYRGGRGDLTPVLEARRLEIETRMNQLTAQAEQARAWANLNFLLPDAKDAK